MNSVDFLANLNDVDDDLLAGAMQTPKARVVRPVWTVRVLTLAASLLLITGISFKFLPLFTNGQTSFSSGNVVAFTLEGRVYETPSLQVYEELGLVVDENGRSLVRTRELDASCLGEEIGEITIQSGEKELSCLVYRYIDAPDSDEYCIVAFPDGSYQLFIAEDKS